MLVVLIGEIYSAPCILVGMRVPYILVLCRSGSLQQSCSLKEF